MRISRIIILSFAVLALLAGIAPRTASAEGMFYMEVAKNGRIYVFNNPEAYKAFASTGETETGITRINAGPNGETMFFDSDDALHLYNFKHNLPDEPLTHAAGPAAPAMQEKLPYHFSGLMFGDYFYNTSRDPLFT